MSAPVRPIFTEDQDSGAINPRMVRTSSTMETNHAVWSSRKLWVMKCHSFMIPDTGYMKIVSMRAGLSAVSGE